MLFGGVCLLVLILPVFLFLLPAEAEIDRTIADIANIYTTNLRNCLPSMLIGAAAGIFAREILRLPRVIYDFVRGLL